MAVQRGKEGKYICCCSLTKLCPTLCNSIDCSTPGLPVPHSLPEFAQTQVHWVGDAIQPSHPLSPSSPLALRTLMGDQPWAKWLLSGFSFPLFILFPGFSCCSRVLFLGNLILCPHPKAPQMHSHIQINTWTNLKQVSYLKIMDEPQATLYFLIIGRIVKIQY